MPTQDVNDSFGGVRFGGAAFTFHCQHHPANFYQRQEVFCQYGHASDSTRDSQIIFFAVFGRLA